MNSFPAAALDSLDFPEVLSWVAEHALTAPGKRAIEAFHPSIGVEGWRARRDRGVEALEAKRAEHPPSVSRAGDPAYLAEIALKRSLNGRELLDVADALECAREMRRWAAGHVGYRALCKTIEAMPDLSGLDDAIRKVLDSRGEVRDEAHPELGKLRALVRKLTESRVREMDAIAERWNKRGVLRQRKPILRGERLLLAVRANYQGKVTGVLHDRSQSGDTVFLEPGQVLVISNQLAEAQHREDQLVQTLLGDLSRQVARAREELDWLSAGMGDVDAALGAAHWCEAVGGVYAEMDEKVPALELRAACHPLLVRQMGAEAVVPLTMSLGDEWDLLVVTGPNTGGKTVALKSVGLLAAMARSGLPITAAEGSRVPLLTGIDADIGDAQSLENSLSTFSGHLQRILRLLATAGPGSLLLLDELGSGTDPEEGTALGRAVLEFLLQKGALVLASTHLGALKLLSLELPRAENASMEFDPATLAPKYRLLVGVPGASHALEVAESLGLPADLLERARHLTRADSHEKVLQRVSEVRRDAEEMRERARDREVEARERLELQREQEEASEYLRGLREGEAEEAYRELCARLGALMEESARGVGKRLPGADRTRFEEWLSAVRQTLDESQLGARRQAFIQSLKKGDVVYIPRFRERCRIARIEKAKERLRVQRGNLEIEVPFREITWVAPPPGDDSDD